MKNSLYTKTIVIAIAASFLIMALNGLGNTKAEDGDVTMERIDFSKTQMNNLKAVDSERMAKLLETRPSNVDGVGSAIMSDGPGEVTPNSVVFNDGFEDDVVGSVPGAPWVATESTSTIFGTWGPDEFEDDVVGENPDSPWKTVDGASTTEYWYQDFEDYGPAGTTIPGTAFYADYGGFYGIEGTLTSVAPPTGTPAGTVMGGSLEKGSFSANWVGGAAYSIVGPVSTGKYADTAYAGLWVNMKSVLASNVLAVMLIDYENWLWGVEIDIAGGDIIHFPANVGTDTGLTYNANTWYELFIEYDQVAQTYSIWWNGAEIAAGSTFCDSGVVNIDSFLLYQEGTGCYFDCMGIMEPPSGGAHDVSVSNAYSSSLYGGTQSVFLDQNGYAGQKASCAIDFPPPYAWGYYAGMSWAVRTDATLADTNGATFRMVDFNDRTLMAIRFSGGNIQYQTGATWTTVVPFTANTEYHFDIWMDCYQKTYSGLYLNELDFYDLTGVPLVNLGAGLAGFIAEGTTGTQSEIYFDHVYMWGDLQDGTIRASNKYAHTGSNSVRMWEANADMYLDMRASLGGAGCTYGEFWFHFYGDGTLGGGSVYLRDSEDANTITIISIGSSLSSDPTPEPGYVKFVDGEGDGSGWIMDGPTIVPNTWNNLSIKYDTNEKIFDVYWNGAWYATYGFMSDVPLDFGNVIFFGEGLAAPSDWFFDDIGLWVDDLPLPATNLRTIFPEPMPSNEAWYDVDLDSAVEGAVTGTYANLAAVDGTTQDIQEATAGGGGGITSYTYSGITSPSSTHKAYECDVDAMPPDGSSVPDGAYLNSQTEATTAEYGLITSSDSNRWITADPGNNDEIFMWSEFVIAENPAYITQIDFNFDGQINIAGNFAVWANNGAWAQVGTTQAAAADTDVVFTRSVTTGCAAYIIGGVLTWGLYSSAASELCRIDMMSVDITYTIPPYYSLEHRWRTESVPTGASVMKLQVTGRTSTGADDTFSFGYATAIGGPYTPIITVNSDTMANYQATMPVMSGQFYINVIDSNSGDASQDTLYVDAISIYWQEILGVTNQNEVATADNPVTGTVTGDYTRTTPITPDGTAQRITEVTAGGDVMFTDGFESGSFATNGWIVQTLSGGDWAVSTTLPQTGTYSALWSLAASYSLGERSITKVMSTVGFNNAQLTYGIRTMDGGDAFYGSAGVSYSTNGADGPWIVLESFTAIMAWTTRGPITLPPACQNANNIALKFWMDYQQSGGHGGDGVAFDNILVNTPVSVYGEHRWTMQNVPMNTMSNTLSVHARTAAGSNPFTVGWSQALIGPYTPLVTINSDAYATYTASIPTNFFGPLYLNVMSNTPDGDADWVDIDSLYVASVVAPVNTSVNVVWDLSGDDGAGYDDVVAYYVYYSDQATAGTYLGPFGYLGSSPAGSNVFRHYGESDDLVDNIWYYVTAVDTHGESAPSGVASKFNLAPDVTTLTVDGMEGVEITAGATLNLFALAYDDSSTWENVLKMDSAEWFVGADPGEGSGTAMSNMGLGTPSVQFSASIDTSLWSEGNYTVYVRAHETGPGNTGTGWGATATVWVLVTGAPPTYDINLVGFISGWAFVSFPIEVSGSILTLLDDSVNGDGMTDWDVAKCWDGSAQAWRTYRKLSPVNTFTDIDNTMGVWVHITANNGDQLLTVGMNGVAPTAAVDIILYAGWNMIGFPSETAQFAADIMPFEADIVGVYNALEPDMVEDFTDMWSVIMSPGNAYWVHVTANCLLTVPVE
ncbi:MAG: hypothetical protein R6W91_02325 [Thermoplasmata archaeon]